METRPSPSAGASRTRLELLRCSSICPSSCSTAYSNSPCRRSSASPSTSASERARPSRSSTAPGRHSHSGNCATQSSCATSTPRPFPVEASRKLREAREGGHRIKRLLIDLQLDVEKQRTVLSEFLAAHLLGDVVEELRLHLGHADYSIRFQDVGAFPSRPLDSRVQLSESTSSYQQTARAELLRPGRRTMRPEGPAPLPTYLAIHFALEDFTLPPRPNLETLLIEEARLTFPISTFFAGYPSLRIFGCKDHPEFCTPESLALIPMTLQHLALFHETAIDALFTIFNDSAGKKALPRHLRTFFLGSGDDSSAPSPDSLKKARVNAGIEFNHYRGSVDIDLVDYEIEEWAYSVGA